MARGPSNRSFGDVMRDIGRALGIGREPERSTNRVGPEGLRPSNLAPTSSPRPERRPTVSMIGGGDRDRGGRDRDGPATPTTPVVAPPTPPVTPEIPPITPAPEVPKAPTKVNPSDMTSTGPSGDLALESAEQGLASTILTSGQGIVEEEEGLLRDRRRLGMLAPRRSLTGGGLIA